MDTIEQYGIKIEHDAAQYGKNAVCMHEHVVYEVYYLISGKRRYLMQHTVYDVEPGNLILIPPGQLHRVTSATKTGYHRYVLYFTKQQAALVSQVLGEKAFTAMFQKGCLQLPGHISRQIEMDMEELKLHLQNPSDESKAVATHLLNGILLNALRFGKKKQQVDGGSADKVQMIARHINENYHEEITLSTAAEMAHMERTYFCKRFKSITGIGFQDYLLQIRLNAAKQMLMETQLSVSEIALNCGFSTSNYFGDAFRRLEGISPSDYRNQKI